MDESELWTNLINVFRLVFDEEDLVIGPTTSAKDIESWDSLSHVQLVVAIEKRFGIRFNLGEVVALENVGQMVNLIKSRIAPG